MARVYRAVHRTTGHDVALKLLEAGIATDKGIRDRFYREGAILRELEHPNIVRYLDSGEDSGRLFIAIELLDGVELEQILMSRTSLSIQEFIAIAIPALDALSYLHSRGLIRNDIKPSNLIISVSGRVCIVDLSTSKRRSDKNHLTSAGLLIGTPNYMAPEQIQGTVVDHRCDIYAFGVMMYRMLSGRMPFEQGEINALVHAVLKTPPPLLSRYRLDISSELEELVLQCLSKEPEARPMDASEIRDRLSGVVITNEANLAFVVAETKRDQESIKKAASADTQGFDKSQSAPGRFTKLFLNPQSWATSTPNIPYSQTPGAPKYPAGATAIFGRPSPEPPRLAIGDFTRMMSRSSLGSEVADIMILEGPSLKHRRFSISKARFSIGRGTENTLVLPHQSVSRFHAEVVRDKDGYWIEDLGSVSGTFRNNNLIVDQTRFLDKDIIKVGLFVFQLTIGWT